MEDLLNTVDLDAKKERLEAEQKRITEKVEQLMARASREVVGDFTEAYGRLEAEMNRASGKLEAVEREKGERAYKERQCRLFMETIQSISNDGRNDGLADNDLFLALVDRVVVGKGMRFVLRDGSEWEV